METTETLEIVKNLETLETMETLETIETPEDTLGFRIIGHYSLYPEIPAVCVGSIVLLKSIIYIVLLNMQGICMLVFISWLRTTGRESIPSTSAVYATAP